MVSINVRAEFSQVFRAIDGLQSDLRNTVIARTLNRLGDSVKTQAVREIAKDFNIKQNKVRERIVVRRAFAKSALAVEVSVTSRNGKRSVNVINFGAKQTKRHGVTVKVKRDGARKTLKNAFIGNAGRTVFSRMNPKTGQVSGRLPIFPVQAIDVPQMFNAKRITNRLLATVKQKFPDEFNRQLAYAISRFK